MFNRIKEFRKRIDDVDSEILDLLEKRLEITKEIIDFKKNNNVQVEDCNREQKIVEHLVDMISEENKAFITKEIIENIWKSIFSMVKHD